LKVNKKLKSGDLMVPAFVRTCVGDQLNSKDINNGHFQRLSEDIIKCVSTIKLVKNCQLTRNGHLLLSLNKSAVTSAVVYNITSKESQNGKSSEGNAQCILLNPAMFWSCCKEKVQENLNLHQLRTFLVCEHIKELLQANGASVKTFPYYWLETQPELGKIPLKQEICQLFTSWDPSSKINPWTEKDLLRKAKELGNTLKKCSCMGTKNIVESGESTESECPSKQSAKAFQSWDCVCEGDCCCAQSFVLDVEGFLKERNQFLGACNKSKVTLSCSLLKDVAKLDLAVNNEESAADMLLHVTSCRRTFIQQQICNVWQIASKSLLACKQFYLTHGPVTVNNDGEKLQENIHAMDLLRVRENQLRESYVLKYGDKVEGHGWETSIRQMAVAAVKLEILSVAPNSEVKINICESSREFRQATFVLYNCARLAKLFQNFEQNVQKGVYPPLPPVKDVDFNLLRDEGEWQLTVNFISAFPSVVKEAVPKMTAESQNIIIHTNKICCFLFNLSHTFSSYYGRVHILGESRHHLFPTMFARLHLMKAIQQIFLNCLKLMNVNSLTQM